MEERRVLDSWKEIAAYLGRSVKTCRRWEHELGLPVHRLEESPKARVFAYPDELDQWIKETQKSETGQKKFKIPAWGISFFFALIFLTIIIAVIWKPFSPQESASPLLLNPSLAVLYFKNNSGDPGLDNWRDALPSLLTVDLSQSRFLRVLDDATVYGILKELDLLGSEKYTPEDLQKIAEEGGASHLLTGSFFTSGERFIVSLSLFDARTGDISKYLKEEAENKDAIYDSVDILTKKIKAALDIPDQLIDEDIDRMIADVYTHNPRALQYYIEGERLHHEMNYRPAIEALHTAIEHDTGFAMAYRILGIIHTNIGDYAEGYKLADKSYRLKDRLPRREQLLLAADLFSQKYETYDKAVDVYKKILKLYPDDFQARHELAVKLREDMGELDLAIKEGEYILYNFGQKKSRLVYWNLAYSYSTKGEYTRARKCFEMLMNEIPPRAEDYLYLWYLFCSEKNFDEALQTLEKARTLYPDEPGIQYHFGFHYWYRDELEKASHVYEEYGKIEKNYSADLELIQIGLSMGKFKQVLSDWEATKSKLSDSYKYKRLSYFFTKFDFYMEWGISLLQMGYPLKALEIFQKAQDFVDEEESRIQIKGYSVLQNLRKNSLLWQTCTLCELGNIGGAASCLKEYKRLIKNPVRKRWQPEMDFLEGIIALAKRRIPEAVNKLEKSLSGSWGENFAETMSYQLYMLDSLAEAYTQVDRLEEAVETYGRIQEFLSWRENWGAIYAKSYYKIGKIYEQLGRKVEAHEKYTKFLDLWKDADPVIAEVEDAKARLSDLQDL